MLQDQKDSIHSNNQSAHTGLGNSILRNMQTNEGIEPLLTTIILSKFQAWHGLTMLDQTELKWMLLWYASMIFYNLFILFRSLRWWRSIYAMIAQVRWHLAPTEANQMHYWLKCSEQKAEISLALCGHPRWTCQVWTIFRKNRDPAKASVARVNHLEKKHRWIRFHQIYVLHPELVSTTPDAPHLGAMVLGLPSA